MVLVNFQISRISNNTTKHSGNLHHIYIIGFRAYPLFEYREREIEKERQNGSMAAYV